MANTAVSRKLPLAVWNPKWKAIYNHFQVKQKSKVWGFEEKTDGLRNKVVYRDVFKRPVDTEHIKQVCVWQRDRN